MVAFVSSSSMVGHNKIGAKAVLLIMIWIGIGHFLITGAAAGISREELHNMLPVLRCRGYNRFGNAMIKTSDLIKVDCLAFGNLTLSAETMTQISGLRCHAVSDLILLPSSTILTTDLLSNHTWLSITGGTGTVHDIAVNGVSPGLYYSSHVSVAGALMIPLLSHFPNCCLPQSPIRATLVQTPSQSASTNGDLPSYTPSLSAYAGPQASSSNGDLPPPPHQPDISIGFSISSTAAAVTTAAIVAGVIIHLFRPQHNLAPLNDDMDDNPGLDDNMDDDPGLRGRAPPLPKLDDNKDVPGKHFAPIDNDLDGFILIVRMILNTLLRQGVSFVRINDEAIYYPVSTERLGIRLKRLYTSRLKILTQPQYKRYRTPDRVILVIEMPDGTSLHIGQVLHYFMNCPVYRNSFIVSLTPVDVGAAPAA